MLQVRLFEHMIYVNRHLQVETGCFGRASLADPGVVGDIIQSFPCGAWSLRAKRRNLPGALPTQGASPFYAHPLSFNKTRFP
jgi:hypothetical protein